MKKISIRYRILLVIIFVQVPFLIMFQIYTRYTIGNMNRQLANGYSEALAVFCNAISKELTDADTFLSVDCWADESFRSVSWAETKAEAEELLVPVMNKAEILLDNSVDISAVFLQVPTKGICIAGYSPHAENTSEDIKRLEAVLTEINADSSQINTAWVFCRSENRPYLVRSFQYGEAFSTVIVDLRRLAGKSQTYYKLSSPVVLMKGGEAVTEAYWARHSQDTLSDLSPEAPYHLITSGDQEYLVVSKSILMLTALYGVRYNYQWDWLNIATYGFFGVTAAAFILAWLSLHLAFFKPLKNLLQVMENIRIGDLTARAGGFKNSEFDYINETFNGMLDTIETLKIQTYENQIQAKVAEMNALRLQIRRHFFLNCLKNIYAMAQTGNIQDIQKSVLLLSVHLRYTLDISQNVVNLVTELKMCQNYIELQGVGQDKRPELTTRLSPGLGEFRVPPISLLTLLENCCKYGMGLDLALKVVIDISLRSLDEQQFVNIMVKDNGGGFSAEMLQLLNSRMEHLNSEGHIGLLNVLARFRMLYGDECAMIFSNSDGAEVELIIPVRKGDIDETVDSR